jgi:hypothetical protein
MAMFSKNMLHESPAHDVDFVSSPYTRIFISRDDGVLVTLLYERNTGTFAWTRSKTFGNFRSVATLPGSDETGFDEIYLIVERNGNYFLERRDERQHVYLDSYEKWSGSNENYDDSAVVFDEQNSKVYPVTQAPAPEEGSVMWIGYPFVSRIRSMPVLANNQMKKQRITSLIFRFLRSYMPKVGSLAGGREIAVNTITNVKEPYSGVWKIPFPGTWDEEVQFELFHEEPTPVTILSINAEAQ